MSVFEFVRKKSIIYFLITWGIGVLGFGILYWLLSLTGQISLGSEKILFGFLSLFKSIYVSLLISILLGLGSISYSGIYTPIVYLHILFSAIILLVLAEKIVLKFVDTHAHQQDKKVNTLMLMMSVIRSDMDRIIHDNRINKKTIKIQDVESIIDGLYVVFLDMEQIFSPKNIHRHKLKNTQYIMLTENLEDSLMKLHKFLTYMEHSHIRWKDKSVEFWVNYILETSEKIILSLEKSNMKSPRLLIAIANMHDHSEKMKLLLS